VPDVRIVTTLPYALALEDGDYPTPSVGGFVTLTQIGLDVSESGAGEPRTSASSVFRSGEHTQTSEVERQRQAVRLFRRVNHLIRWYRAASAQPEVLELSLAQAGRFTFIDEATGATWGGRPLEYTLPPATPRPPAEIDEAVRAGLASRAEPDVGVLNVLDAVHAMNTGRFREAVLLAWSAIDATFAQAYERVVGPMLAGEYAEGRDFLLGHEIPMKVRMSAVLYLAARRSMFRDLGPDGWAQLVASYNIRNDVVHRGAIATEAQAEASIAAARRVIAVAQSL